MASIVLLISSAIQEKTSDIRMIILLMKKASLRSYGEIRRGQKDTMITGRKNLGNGAGIVMECLRQALCLMITGMILR